MCFGNDSFLGPSDRMFDFNRDGKLDLFEQAAKYEFLEEMFSQDEKDDDELEGLEDETD